MALACLQLEREPCEPACRVSQRIEQPIVRSHSPNWRPSANPLPLSLAEFLMVALGLAVWCFALNGFPLRLARSAFSARRWMVAAGSSTHPQRLLS